MSNLSYFLTSNTILLIVELMICLLMIPIVYKISKTEGLYIYTITALFISSLMSLKVINIFSFDVNLGFIPLMTIFIASNIIVQKQGKEELKKLILTLIITASISYIVILLIINLNFNEDFFRPYNNLFLFTNKSFDNILIDSHRIYFANIVTLLYSLIINSKLYYYLKTEKNKIWISNLFSAIIVQFIASILFSLLAYTFIIEPLDLIKRIIIRYALSIIVLIFGTATIYFTTKIKDK